MQEGEAHKYITPRTERRRHKRTRLVTQVKCEGLAREDYLLSRDISLGGLFVASKTPYPIDQEVTVTFRIKASDRAITCQGKVVYTIEGLGMGIQFLDLNEEAHQIVQKFVDEAA